jgi:hypothetical protein
MTLFKINPTGSVKSICDKYMDISGDIVNKPKILWIYLKIRKRYSRSGTTEKRLFQSDAETRIQLHEL